MRSRGSSDLLFYQQLGFQIAGAGQIPKGGPRTVQKLDLIEMIGEISADCR